MVNYLRWSTAPLVSLLQATTSTPVVETVMAVDETGRQTATVALAPIWKARLRNPLIYALDLLSVFVIYLFSELVIWGLSAPLSRANLQFFSSILGMILVFVAMIAAHSFSQSTEAFYVSHLKAKVDFINAHLGLGFPIPLVKLDETQMLKPGVIARIIGNFLLTNLASWTVFFFLSFGLLVVVAAFALRSPSNWSTSDASRTTTARGDSTPDRGSTVDDKESRLHTPASQSNLQPAPLADPEVANADEIAVPALPLPQRIGSGNSAFPIPMALFGILAFGLPVAMLAKDHRILDCFWIWFIWMLCVRVQKQFKTSSWMTSQPRSKNIVATLLNPVLFTTLLLTAYTRSKVAIVRGPPLADMLKIFSGGSPLYALWTAKVTGNTLPSNPTGWFGAGDAALSLLECGLLVWGFKLYECRRQLFSMAGLCTVIISIIAAVANVFLCTLTGTLMGMAAPEALAFSARSVTLALSKPAMQIVGGSVAVNAALVVSNGILGQLMYPFVLHKLGAGPNVDDIVMVPLSRVHARQPTPPQPRIVRKSFEQLLGDSPATIAAGITVGINGAAMGVAYLYATKSRAAPYAALAMTVFGVMTVVLTTVDPFKQVLLGLTSM